MKRWILLSVVLMILLAGCSAQWSDRPDVARPMEVRGR